MCGLGSIGRRHLRNLLAIGGMEPVLLHTGLSTLPEDELNGFPIEQDLHQALERWRPDAAIIATPTALHLDTAIPAAKAGCQLLIEKPLSHSMDRVAELQAALARSGAGTLIGYQFRFHPGLQRVRALLSGGAIGRPATARAHYGECLKDWHPWEDYRKSYSARQDLGGGALLTLSHPIDTLNWLFGKFESAHGQARKLSDLDIDVDDTVELLIEYAQGVLASVHMNYLERPMKHTLEIVGTSGKLAWDAADGSVHLWSGSAEQPERISLPSGYERNDMFLDEMRHFKQVMDGEADPACSVADGVQVLEICLQLTKGERAVANNQ